MANGLSFPTILVAERDDGVRRPIVRHLQYHGYFVLVAHDAAEALEITRVHSRPIHLLLTGEGLDGRTLAATLKQYRPNMQVLFITACMRLNSEDAGDSDATLNRVRECVEPPAARDTSKPYPLSQTKSA